MAQVYILFRLITRTLMAEHIHVDNDGDDDGHMHDANEESAGLCNDGAVRTWGGHLAEIFVLPKALFCVR